MEIFKILNNGTRFPAIGVGTYLMRDEANLKEILEESFKIGYRLIDTAKVYRNEHIIGDVMSSLDKHGLKREDIYLTTKISPSTQGRGVARQAFLEQLKDLKVDYVDLVLIHFPGSSKLKHSDPTNAENRRGTYLDLEDLHREGRIKSIGVSNYTRRHLEELLSFATIAPVVNQVELHPLYYDADFLDFCAKNRIIVQAYSSLGSAGGFNELTSQKTLDEIAARNQRSKVQILLKWALQHDLAIIPKTSNLEHLRENFQLWDFTISQQDMQLLDSINQGHKFCWDPKEIV